MDTLREKIARIIWEAEPESKIEHFDNLLCGPILGDLYSTADAILEIPEIKEALAMQAAHRTGQVFSDAIAAIYPGTPPESPANPHPKREA